VLNGEEEEEAQKEKRGMTLRIVLYFQEKIDFRP
jgi:hypothetical protein